VTPARYCKLQLGSSQVCLERMSESITRTIWPCRYATLSCTRCADLKCKGADRGWGGGVIVARISRRMGPLCRLGLVLTETCGAAAFSGVVYVCVIDTERIGMQRSRNNPQIWSSALASRVSRNRHKGRWQDSKQGTRLIWRYSDRRAERLYHQLRLYND
jgi:hypothetical protein